MKQTLGGIMLLDESLRADHVFLTAADECRCLAEYLPAHGYRAGHVNQFNYQPQMSALGRADGSAAPALQAAGHR